MTRITTGVAELDLLLGGGLRRGSLVVLAGSPGSGKTILAQQICFANVRSGGSAVYYTTLSESHTKLLQHLNQFAFFDESALDERIHFVNLGPLFGDEANGLRAVSEEVTKKSFRTRPSVIVIDSSKAMHEFASTSELRTLFYELASRVGHTDAVLIFVGEYTMPEMDQAPEFAVADGIIQLTNEPRGELDRRWLRILKLRGSNHLQGRHSFRIDESGIEVFPRLETIVKEPDLSLSGRISIGVTSLDEAMGGGIPTNDSVLVVGPSGVGKTVLSLQFAAKGIEQGEKVLYVSLQESAEQLFRKAQAFGFDLRRAVETGQLEILHVPPVEVNLDEVGGIIRSALSRSARDRVVIDSLTELVVSREVERLASYVWALGSLVRGTGATLLVTEEESGKQVSLKATTDMRVFFDNTIDLRYIEGPAETERVLRVVKMRRSEHDKRLFRFAIGQQGLSLYPA